jgi:hypothetical protein
MKRILCILGLVSIIVLALPVSASAGELYDGKVILGGTFTLPGGEILDGDLAIFGGAATLEGASRVTGSVIVVGGNLEARGVIDGDLVVIGGNANIGPNAEVQGELWELGGNINQGGALVGDVNKIEGLEIPFEFDNLQFDLGRGFSVPFRHFPINPQARVVGYLFTSFVLTALAVLVVMFWPKATDRVAKAIVTQPVISGGMGLLTFIVLVPFLLLLAVSICFSPVSLIGFLVLGLAWLFGIAALGLEVGNRLEKALDHDLQPIMAAGLGTMVMTLVVGGLIFIPCLGFLGALFLGFFGLGGVLLTRFGTQSYPKVAEGVLSPDKDQVVEIPPPDPPIEEEEAEAKSEPDQDA